MRKVKEDAKKSFRELIERIMKDEFPVEIKAKYLTDHFVALFEHLDEPKYEQGIYDS